MANKRTDTPLMTLQKRLINIANNPNKKISAFGINIALEEIKLLLETERRIIETAFIDGQINDGIISASEYTERIFNEL